jgi:O-antigen/teichoic acid export membrane protein
MLLGNYRLDQWLLGGIAGPRELGLYSVAVAWAETLFFLPTALALAQRPDLVRATREGAERKAAVAFRVALFLTLGLAIAMVAFAPLLCVTLFGEPFRGSVEMLRVLTVGVFGIVALKLLGNALTAQRKPMLETAAIALAFVCVIALDVILIPAHGGLGAAWASAVAYSVGGVTVAVIFVRALGGRARDLLPHGGDLAQLRRRLRPASMATDRPPSDAS